MNSNFFNLESWPIIYIKNDNGYFDDNLLEEYKKDYLNILIRCKNNKEKIITLINIYSNSNISLPHMQKMSKFHKEIYDYNKKYVEYVYILCADKNIKNMLTLFLAMEKPASPYKIVRSLEKLEKAFESNHNYDIKEKEIIYNMLKNEINDGN